MGRSSPASETACHRTCRTLSSECPTIGGETPTEQRGVRSAASWLARCAHCAPLPQPRGSRFVELPGGCLHTTPAPNPGTLQKPCSCPPPKGPRPTNSPQDPHTPPPPHRKSTRPHSRHPAN